MVDYISITKGPTPPCQYFFHDEPSTCKYWGAGCEFDVTKGIPSMYPYCNLIGTDLSCDKYEGTGGTQAICILPDPKRHVCNRLTGEKWVVMDSGGLWDFSPITGYNDGFCDGGGTDVECAAYSPYHMGFGALVPSASATLDSPKLSSFSKYPEFSSRLPLNYVICNLRALLSRCYWWNDDARIFTISDIDGDKVVTFEGSWACRCPVPKPNYKEFSFIFGAPCNGCKPECSNYIGVCWQYCIDDKMRTGDPLLAEQIHELRYYHRESNWVVERLKDVFIDEGVIFSWKNDETVRLKGILSYTSDNIGRVVEYQIPAIKTTMVSFDEFEVIATPLVLTQGTTVSNILPDYPTLVREVQVLSLFPIIKNVFLKNEQGTNIFETKYLKDDIFIAIYGKVFVNSKTYAMNISDKELHSILPQELYMYEDMYALEQALTVTQLERYNKTLLATIAAIKAISPEKIVENQLPNEDLTFINIVPVLSLLSTFGNNNYNIILIFQEHNGQIVYDKVEFTKVTIGGALFQTSFSVTGPNAEIIPPIPYFEKSFMAHINKNGVIEFKFSGFESEDHISLPLYFYNDAVMHDEVAGTVSVGFKNYAITIKQYILESDEFLVLGGNGWHLVTLNEPYINIVVKMWEVEKIEILYGETGNRCEMVVVLDGSLDLLRPNQVIIAPKDIVEFKTICKNNDAIIFTNLKYWERRSYNELPITSEFALVEEEEKPENQIDISTVGTMTFAEGLVIVKDFDFTFVPTVVIADIEGRAFTQYKTKPIGMVKQVGCPEVEIYYKWTSNYSVFQNIPVCTCCGPAVEQRLPNNSTASSAPPCGDHFECEGCFPAAVWWPFNRCDEYQSYQMITNQDNYDTNMIGLFRDKVGGEWAHGSFDMRMLGPHNYYAWGGTFCNPLKPCACVKETFGSHRIDTSSFTGYDRVRGGVDDSQLLVWYLTGSNPVMQFGNERRSVLRSYLTIEQVVFTQIDKIPKVRIYSDVRLMPAGMRFSKSDITDSSDEMWMYFCSDTYPGVVNPLGFFLANSFDGIQISESLEVGTRYRFEEIITCRSLSCMGYPKTTAGYKAVIGDCSVNPWYEFKSVDGVAIQWAWQEYWRKLKRNVGVKKSYSAFITQFLSNQSVGNIKGTFVESGVGVSGCFVGLDVSYPKYLYDYQCKEYRIMPDEGASTLFFIAPNKDNSTGEYIGYPAFRLNTGPKRGINWAGEWLTVDNQDGDIGDEDIEKDYYASMYEHCTDPKGVLITTGRERTVKWVDDVTLFIEDNKEPYEETAESNDRVVYTYIDGEIVWIYFQRGLNIGLHGIESLKSLPLKITEISQLTVISDIVDSDGSTGTLGFSSLDVACGSRYSVYCDFDNKKCTVSKLKMTFKFGVEIKEGEQNIEDPDLKEYNYYHIPKITVRTFKPVSLGKVLFSTNSMELCDDTVIAINIVERVWSWDNSWDYIAKGEVGIAIIFESESTVINEYIHVNSIQVYEEILIDATESLDLYERRYNVSKGLYGDIPFQGDGSTQVLNKAGDDMSTYWQTDTEHGVAGVAQSSGALKFGSKTMCRQVGDIYKDKTKLTGVVAASENLQKILYDEAVNLIQPVSTMRGIIPIGLQQLLNNNGVKLSGPTNLVLTNTLNNSLAAINNFPIMYPGGHLYLPSTYTNRPGCPGPPQCQDGGGDGFHYFFTTMENGGFITHGGGMDSLDQYYQGTIQLMRVREEAANLAVGLHVRWYSRSLAHKIYTGETFFNLSFPAIPIRTGYGAGDGYLPGKKRNLSGIDHYWVSGMSIITY